jgi:hypothetical protein
MPTIILSLILLTIGCILSITLIYLFWHALMLTLSPNRKNTELDIKVLPSLIFQKILRWRRYRKLNRAKEALVNNRSKTTLTELAQCFIFFPCSQGDLDEWTEHNYEVIRSFLQVVDQFGIPITNLTNLDGLFERRINLVKIRVDNLRKLQRIRAKQKVSDQKSKYSAQKHATNEVNPSPRDACYKKTAYNKNTDWAHQEMLNMLAETNQELTLNMREIRATLNEIISMILQGTHGGSSNEEKKYNDTIIH